MRNEQELESLRDELNELVAYIMSYGDEDLERVWNVDKNVSFACDAYDVLRWVLGEEPTDVFKSSDYLDIKYLKSLVRKIEKRTNKKFEDFKNENQ